MLNAVSAASPCRFAGKFRLVPDQDWAKEKLGTEDSLELSNKNLSVEYGGRSKGYVNRLKILADKVKTGLSDNVEVQFSVSSWGGSSAYDNVLILIKDKTGKIIGRDSFFRNINEYDSFLNTQLFLPKAVRDKLFFARVMHRAKALQAHPEIKRYKDDDGLGDPQKYVGLW